MATLTITSNDNNGIVVLRGARAWIESRAVAYRKKGFNILISWEQK